MFPRAASPLGGIRRSSDLNVLGTNPRVGVRPPQHPLAHLETEIPRKARCRLTPGCGEAATYSTLNARRPPWSRPMALARSTGVWTTSVRPYRRATAALMTSVSCSPVGGSGGGGAPRPPRPPWPPDDDAAPASDESPVCGGGAGAVEAEELDPVEPAEPDGAPAPGAAGLPRAMGISSAPLSTGMMGRGTGLHCT
jgi:hypothetical protein